jgi:CubicO group peptidase (beta-lactamase class C family)
MRFRRILFPAAGVAVLALGFVAADQLDNIPAGTGYAAQDLCTRTWVSGDDFDRVREDYVAAKVAPLPLVWDIQAEPGEQVAVLADLPVVGDRRISVYRPGLGCTLVTNQQQAEALHEQRFDLVPPVPARDAPWPAGEQPAQDGGFSGQQAAIIQRHADSIFSEPSPDPAAQHHTVALTVALDGALVFERYDDGYHREQRQLGWSMTKTVTGLVAGLMITDGLFSLDDPVGLKQWQGTEKENITWRQLLNMAPGLEWFEGYGGASDVTHMLFSEPDHGGWAASLPLVAEPGTVFNYSTGTSNIAMLAMKEKLGGAQALYDYYQTRLFVPLGIRNGLIEPDVSGTPSGGSYGVLRPVDWLRLGQLVANGGTWQGERLIDRTFMDYMVAPSPAAAEYGGSIWRQPSDMIPAELRQRLPEDLVWFAGHMGQFVVIVPGAELVVARLGVAFDKPAARAKVFALTADLLETL